MTLWVEVGVTTCQGVGLGKGVGVAWRAALVSACSGFSVGVAGKLVTRGVIFGAGTIRLQPDSIKTKTLQNNRLKTRIMLIDPDSNTPQAGRISFNSKTLNTP